MKTGPKNYKCLYKIICLLISFLALFNNSYSQESKQTLVWSIESEKKTCYPGEPVLLKIHIKNMGLQKETIFFGADGIEAFSLKIYDPNMNTVCGGEKIKRDGFGRRGSFPIPAEKTAEKCIVLNQWCSTLLPPGNYHIVCTIDYVLFSELQEQADTRVLKAGPLHQKILEMDIQVIQMNRVKFEEILKTLAGFETQKETQTNAEWITNRDLAREMLAFTESELAVPYQLHLLNVDQFTWRKRDTIHSLIRSGSAQAAKGLVQIFEKSASRQIDVENDMIRAIFQMRETGKPEILEATKDFAEKYKHPKL